MPWFFPTSLFLLALSVWILASLFSPKSSFHVISIASAVAAGVSMVMLLGQGYWGLASLFFGFTLMLAILCFGFNLQFFQERHQPAQGPLAGFVAQTGIAHTNLEPQGQVRVADQIIPATTEGLFLPAGTEVKVIRCGKNLVVVEKLQAEE